MPSLYPRRAHDAQLGHASHAPSQSTASLSSSQDSHAHSPLFVNPSPSISSQSDLAASDTSVLSLSSPKTAKARLFPFIARSAPHMGQVLSRPPSSLPPSPVSPPSIVAAGNRLKRAFAGRRKKSQDLDGLLSDTEGPASKGKEKEPAPGFAPAPNSDAASIASSSSHAFPGAFDSPKPKPLPLPQARPAEPASAPRGVRNLSIQIAGPKLNLFNKKSGQSPKSPQFSGAPPEQPSESAPVPAPSAPAPQAAVAAAEVEPESATPPPPPPKPVAFPVKEPPAPIIAPSTAPTSLSVSDRQPSTPKVSLPSSPRSPPPPATPQDAEMHRIAPANGDTLAPKVALVREDSADLSASLSQKEDWRKSDSTMTSHYTIRPGALGGSRSPRPVSLAESSHSGNTIVPPMNKRFSAIITDAEFAMLEESPPESESELIDSDILARLSGGSNFLTTPQFTGMATPERTSMVQGAAAAVKARNRRSISLNLGPSSPKKATASIAPDTPPRASRFASDSLAASPLFVPGRSGTPTLSRAAANGFIAPSAPDAGTSTGQNIRRKLAAWTAASLAPSAYHPARRERESSRDRPTAPELRTSPSTGSSQASFRQTAVSMTGIVAPAAGLAMGFGKRAVERVGRAWGGLGSSNTHSTYAQSANPSETSLAEPTSHYPQVQSLGTGEKRRFRRRTGGGGFSISGSASVASTSSSASVSDVDHFVSTGPTLGVRVRGPKIGASGARVAGGLVFRRALKDCVRDTAIDSIKDTVGTRDDAPFKGVGPLEERWIPALALRCAQHLHKWGVQEEGLFRVSGRASHVAKLRSEFDVGADYDMAMCDPGDLDPHAVASIFKTYLRELPESILTTALMPYFEEALKTEEQVRTSMESQASTGSPAATLPSKASLPSNPRAGAPHLRKPPSLSTLALPSFAKQAPVSENLLNALTWVVAQLPRENRDLLYTLVELVRATAARSAQTKMPMGNLLLVLCPSLNVNPTLLRVLCEAETIWHGIPQAPSPVAKEKEREASPDEDVRASFATAIDMSDVGSESASEGPEPSSSGEQTTEDESWTLDTPDGSLSGEHSESFLDAGQLVTRISTVSVVKSDDASYMSAQELLPCGEQDPLNRISVHSSPYALPMPVASSSSRDSFFATSEQKEHSPAAIPEPSNEEHHEVESDDSEEQATVPADVSHSQEVIVPPVSESALPTPRPIPFPSSGRDSPITPPSHRKSFSLLSFPPMRSAGGETTTSTGSWPVRHKRPSLHLLFTKSMSRLTMSPTSTQPFAAASVPSLAATLEEDIDVPRTSRSLAPPTLDTAISSSPMRLEFNDLPTPLVANNDGDSTPADETVPEGLNPRDSYAPSIYTTPVGSTGTPVGLTSGRKTPIADLYKSPSKSLVALDDEEDDEHPPPINRARSESAASQISVTPSLQLELGGPTDDWARSVQSLLADPEADDHDNVDTERS